MIKTLIKEHTEGDYAVRTALVTFFGIPIYKYKKLSTNRMAVQQLTIAKSIKNVTGFKYETNNKSKKTKSQSGTPKGN